MKLAKSIIVTGILFSSILGGVNASNIVSLATAASDSNQLPNEQEVTIKFENVDDNSTMQATINSNESKITKEKIATKLKDAYPDYGIFNIQDEYNVDNKVVKVEVSKKKNITLHYLNGETELENTSNSIEVLTATKELGTNSLVEKIPSGYKASETILNLKNLNTDGSLNVKVVPITSINSKKEVQVKFKNVNSKSKDKIDIKYIKVDSSANKISKQDLDFDDNKYELVGNDSWEILKDGNLNYVEVSFKPKDTIVNKPNTSTNATQNLNVTVTYINKATNKTITTSTITGKVGDQQKLTLPKGYKLANGENGTIKLDSKTKAVKVYLVKESNKGVVSNHRSVVSVNGKGYARLYDQEGKEITNRVLSNGSDWASDETMVLDGVTYYRVATNEWAKASEVLEYTENITTIQTTGGQYKVLFDENGKQISNRAIAGNSSWFTDRTATINGIKMYHVATNEWLRASDVK
ncbi:SLAP domain-containing protein [Companilactobacillus halodurans]|uniref:S-layer protein C-terminal domain-containing protein n=1 Tax=Companilactobacillus halodurans TaxID=2584183 RepID=A0A5P0ZWQ9_9LACO|nr:SLAP domain-containing protein [Companilactobacillus halodurans]MQS97471.1 hypothetical protein [Companilactobacillus halodurans]